MTFLTNPRRDASQTIAGFVFQVNVTILRWMELHEGEHLELECGEDIDTVKGIRDDGVDAEVGLLEQLKVRSGKSITLKSPEALEALSNFCDHRASNPSSNLRFRYVTTANSGFEQGWDLPDSGIETRMGLQRGRYDDSTRKEVITALRAFLKSCTRPEKAPKESWQALQQVLASDDDADLTEVILRFEWGIGYGDYLQKENQILSALSRDGHAKTAEEANHAYEHLLAFVFRFLCQPGKKVLTINQLATELQTPPLTQADRAIVQLVRNELAEIALRIEAVETAMTLQANDVTALKQIRLTTLKLQGRSTASTATSLAEIESVIRPDLLPENFITELRQALVDEIDWQVLRDEGYRAIEAHEYVRGFTLCIGAADRAPISMSLYLQIYLAENFEKMFQTYRSIYREVVAPFFVAYWKRTIRTFSPGAG
jgi:hypothetical protein